VCKLETLSHFTRNRTLLQERLLAAGLLILLTFFYFWLQLVTDKHLYWGDIGLYFRPMLEFLHAQLLLGRIPLWNPNILCGAPYVGNPQTWPLYPSSILLLLTNTDRAISLMIAAHIWLAGFGMFLFLRNAANLRFFSSLFGAIVFMFGGQIVSKEQFPNMVQAISYLPLILLGVHRIIQFGRLTDSLALGVIIGLELLAAHAQMTMLILYLSTVYAILTLVRLKLTTLRDLRPVAGLLILAMVLGIGLSAGQILPCVELYEHAWRQKLSLAVVDRFILPWNQIGNFLLPMRHGHPYFANFTARGNFWETCCYLGIVPFILSAFGAVIAWSQYGKLEPRFWTIVALLSVWMAHGGSGGLYTIAYEILPGFRSFHDPARCLLWASFAMAVLSGYGFNWAMRLVPKHKYSISVCLLMLLSFVDLWSFGQSIYPLQSSISTSSLLGSVPVPREIGRSGEISSHQARIFAPDTSRVWQQFTAHQSFRQEVPDYQAKWFNTLTPNLPMSLGIYDAYGYEPVTRNDAQIVLGLMAHASGPDGNAHERDRAMSLAGALGVKYLIFDRGELPERNLAGLSGISQMETLSPVSGREHNKIFLSSNNRWQPRARLIQSIVSVPTQADELRQLSISLTRGSQFDPSKSVLIAGDIDISPSIVRPSDSVELTDKGPDDVTVLTATSGPEVLLLADTLHPGWTATLNDRPTRTFSADGFLRAVAIPTPGENKVRFTYKPTTFFLGLYVTLMTISVILALSVRMAVLAARRQTADEVRFNPN
jgi:hypothetical protein